MTAAPAITVLVEEVPKTLGPDRQWHEDLGDYENLASELRKHTSATVAARVGVLADAPPGMVLARLGQTYNFQTSPILSEQERAIAARTIILNVALPSWFQILERYRFAGAIDTHRWFKWIAE